MYIVKLTSIFLIFSTICFSQNLPSEVDIAWEKIKSGSYRIDTASDDGTAYMPVITDENKTIYLLRDYSKMLDLSGPDLVKQIPFSMCTYTSNKDYPKMFSFEDACKSLNKDPSTYQSSILQICLKQIKKKISIANSPISQEKTLQNLYKLPKYQQDFAAAVFTGYGEGRGESDQEVALIFKTIANRIKYAKDKGCKKANALDVALQRFQFSMWNKTDPNWSKAISIKSEEYSETKQQNRMIDVFINFKNNKYNFTPKKNTDKIYHYRTKSIGTIPAWGKTSRAIKILKVDGHSLGTSNLKAKNAHYFFKSVPWSFRYHPLRPKIKGEDKCY